MNDELKKMIKNVKSCMETSDYAMRGVHMPTLLQDIDEMIFQIKIENKGLNSDFIIDYIFFEIETNRYSMFLIDLLINQTSCNNWTIYLFNRIEQRLSKYPTIQKKFFMNNLLRNIFKYHNELNSKTLMYLTDSSWPDAYLKFAIKNMKNYKTIASIILDEIK